MSDAINKRYAGGDEGLAQFSIRERSDGSFQIYRDNRYAGCNQPQQFDGDPISSLFVDLESAEAEQFRDPAFRPKTLH
jgi:hypothetical protein